MEDGSGMKQQTGDWEDAKRDVSSLHRAISALPIPNRNIKGALRIGSTC